MSEQIQDKGKSKAKKVNSSAVESAAANKVKAPDVSAELKATAEASKKEGKITIAAQNSGIQEINYVVGESKGVDQNGAPVEIQDVFKSFSNRGWSIFTEDGRKVETFESQVEEYIIFPAMAGGSCGA